ncbi:exonuclease SbcC, partial [Escherichia coli]
MFNVLDESIARLQGEISAKSSLVTELNRKYQIISEFLRDTDYETIESIDDEINRIDLVLEELVAGLSALDKNMKADSIQYTELKDAHNFISLKYKECILNITALEDKIDKYSR